MNISKVGVNTVRAIALSGLLACAASCRTPCNCRAAETKDCFTKEKTEIINTIINKLGKSISFKIAK